MPTSSPPAPHISLQKRCGLLRLCRLLLLPAAFSGFHASAQDTPKFSREQLDFFEARIRPVLVEHCYECHAADSRPLQGGLRLDSRAGLLQGGELLAPETHQGNSSEGGEHAQTVLQHSAPGCQE